MINTKSSCAFIFLYQTILMFPLQLNVNRKAEDPKNQEFLLEKVYLMNEEKIKIVNNEIKEGKSTHKNCLNKSV